MAIDYLINFDCVPKQTMGMDGILERVKGRERAERIIQLFRLNGDQRPPSEMGFEFTRTAADGTEETQVIVVQHLLDEAVELDALAHHCAGCPANALRRPFGCHGQINYPLSGAGETWFLDQLPLPTQPLTWMLLRQGVRDFDYDGATAAPLRAADRTYFSEPQPPLRELGQLRLNSDQVFEMVFLVGHIHPNHAGVLLLFFDAIDREIEADDIIQIGTMPAARRAEIPFRHYIGPDDDPTTAELKQFLHALYTAWTLSVHLLLDV